MLRIILILVLACFCLNNVESIELNMTAYFEMPPLYDFDDYDRCLQEYQVSSTSISLPPSPAYCLVRAQVLPQTNSSIWQTIEEVSQYERHHFDHRQLNFGLCVRWCEDALGHLDASTAQSLFGGSLNSNEKVNVYLQLFSMEQKNRQRYNVLLNQCINLRLNKEYNLSSESIIEYCDANNQINEHDPWNQAFYSIVGTLMLLTTCSSFYDLFLKHQRKDKLLTAREHYRTPVPGTGNRIGVTFSLARNWYRLSQKPLTRTGHDLRFLDCIKFFSMFLVIFSHINWIFCEAGTTNPQDQERLVNTAMGTLIVSGPLITLTFFVISGLLLTINWFAENKANNELSCTKYALEFAKFNVFRYIRLTGLYAFVLLLSGVRFTDPEGPLYRHIVEREQLACRKNWWTNLLYVNTFVNTDERCLIQSWYLASDTHAFILGLLVLIIVTKWPKIRCYFFSIIVAICFIIPGVFVYVSNGESLFITTLQSQRDSYIGFHQFTEFYTPFYMNFGPYFFGLLAGLVYNEYNLSRHKMGQRKDFQIIWYTLIPVGILWLFSAHTMFQDYENRPSIVWRSLYAAAHRNVWGLGVAALIIGMSVRIGWIIREFACLPIFPILGRLTYGAFMVHMFIARNVLAPLRQPIYFGMGVWLAFTLFTLTASYLFSLMLALLVELPLLSIMKLMR